MESPQWSPESIGTAQGINRVLMGASAYVKPLFPCVETHHSSWKSSSTTYLPTGLPWRLLCISSIVPNDNRSNVILKETKVYIGA